MQILVLFFRFDIKNSGEQIQYWYAIDHNKECSKLKKPAKPPEVQSEPNFLQALFNVVQHLKGNDPEPPKKQIIEETIPCEFCGQNVTFDKYAIHIDEHKAKENQIKEEQNSKALIPCDICHKEILFADYENHIIEHNSKKAVPPPVSVASPSTSPPIIPENSSSQSPQAKEIESSLNLASLFAAVQKSNQIINPSKDEEIKINIPKKYDAPTIKKNFQRPVTPPPLFESKPLKSDLSCTICGQKFKDFINLHDHEVTHLTNPQPLLIAPPIKEEAKCIFMI